MIHIWTLFCVNVLLLTSYYYTGLSVQDFGQTPKFLHKYMLASALLAYILNIFFVLRFTDKSAFNILAIYIAIYYLLQLLFIPLVRLRKRKAVQFLLFLCTLPIAAMAKLAIVQKKDVIISMLVLAHVLINDFFLFAFLF